MLGIDVWISAGLLAFSLAVTLLVDWLFARRHGEPLWPRGSPVHLVDTLIGRLVWVALLYAGLAIGLRYLERVENALPGYALLILLAGLLSILRAALYRRTALHGRRACAAASAISWNALLHNAIYFLAALLLLLVLVWLSGQRLHWPAVLVLLVGVLLPDLDDQSTLLGRALPFVSGPLHNAVGKGKIWHTPVVAAGFLLLGLPLLAVGGWQVWIALPLGFTAHLLVDLLYAPGVMLLWPLSQTRHLLAGQALQLGGRSEGWLAAVLGLAAILLALLVGVGEETPPPVVVPSYEQTLDRYYAERGRTLVFLSVQGTWQASGRRMSGTFEVLNASGSSFILLDRYTGDVFSAGRSAEDSLYLNSVSLRTGESVNVKPAEIHLAGEPLSRALPVLYQMQAEPGLQHIFVSGDLIVAPGSPSPSPNYGLTSLRRIQELGEGHYSLRYLTAAELIALGGLQVETADLLAVATYVVAASGPTVTPLPAPPAGGGSSP